MLVAATGLRVVAGASDKELIAQGRKFGELLEASFERFDLLIEQLDVARLASKCCALLTAGLFGGELPFVILNHQISRFDEVEQDSGIVNPFFLDEEIARAEQSNVQPRAVAHF